MLRGARLRPKAIVEFFCTAQEETTSCAWGAALEVLLSRTVVSEEDAWNVLRGYGVMTRQIPCPVCRDYDTVYMIVGAHLNDTHNWGRGQIALWLSTQGY
jgi:hypothetical protein